MFIFSWSDLLQFLRMPAAFSFTVLCTLEMDSIQPPVHAMNQTVKALMLLLHVSGLAMFLRSPHRPYESIDTWVLFANERQNAVRLDVGPDRCPVHKTNGQNFDVIASAGPPSYFEIFGVSAWGTIIRRYFSGFPEWTTNYYNAGNGLYSTSLKESLNDQNFAAIASSRRPLRTEDSDVLEVSPTTYLAL